MQAPRSPRTCALVLAVAGAIAAAPQAIAEPAPPTLQVTGRASETRRPDRALIDLGVITRRERSSDAATANAREARALLVALRPVVDASAVKTVSYTLRPEVTYQENAAPKITGYIAQSIVRVTLDDLDRIGNVIDRATSAGANRVERLQLTLRDPSDARAAALEAAVRDARRLAARLAAAAGVELAGVHAVSETAPATPFVRELALARTDRATTPIVAGTLEIEASVTVTYEIAPRRRR